MDFNQKRRRFLAPFFSILFCFEILLSHWQRLARGPAAATACCWFFLAFLTAGLFKLIKGFLGKVKDLFKEEIPLARLGRVLARLLSLATSFSKDVFQNPNFHLE